MLLLFLVALLLYSQFPLVLAACEDACKASPGQHQLHVVVLLLLPHSNSPALDLMGVASHLQARGHRVLVVTTTPAASGYLKRASARHTSNTTAEAMQYIAAEAPEEVQQQQHHMQFRRKIEQSWKVPGSWLGQALVGPRLVDAMQDSMAAACGQVVTNTTVMKTIRDFKPDAILPLVLLPIGPSLATDSCGCVMSTLLGGVPFVEVDAPMATFWVNPLNTPQFGSGVHPESLQHPLQHPMLWLRNAATWLAMQLLPMWLQLSPAPPPHSQASFAAIRSQLSLPPAASFGWPASWLQRLKGGKLKPQQCQPLLRILPGTWLLEYPRPLQPNQVLTGVGSPRPAQPLTSPPEAADFVAGAKEGLVLVGFGTGKISNTSRSAWLQLVDFRELAQGFAALAPVRVLWNLQGGLPEGTEDVVLGDNTLIVGSWIDYNDVLGHPNTRAFVTHCGLHSVNEGLYHGVPLVGVPFMFEQAHTCTKAVLLGAAEVSPESPAFRSGSHQLVHFTAEGVAGSISKVLNSSSIADAAAGVSHILKQYAARRQPYARAADEVELAVMADKLARQRRASTEQPQPPLQQQQQAPHNAAAGAGVDRDKSEL